MIKAIITEAVISKGYNGAPALRFSENNSAVQFKIGRRVYDSRAKENHRYINLAVKAFAPVCERVEKMKLKEGSYINIIGRLDEEQWEDNGQQLSRFVIIAEDIEYSGNGTGNGKSSENGNGTNGAGSAVPTQNGQGNAAQKPQTAPKNSQEDQTGMPSGFTGYQPVGEENPFF